MAATSVSIRDRLYVMRVEQFSPYDVRVLDRHGSFTDDDDVLQRNNEVNTVCRSQAVGRRSARSPHSPGGCATCGAPSSG
jgi:hypothetical protein